MNLFHGVRKINWLEIMKISCTQLLFVILFAGVSYARDSNAQINLHQRVSISVRQARIADILRQLEKTTRVKFVYSENVVDVNQTIALTARHKRLDSVLNTVLCENGINYEVINNRIVLSAASAENHAHTVRIDPHITKKWFSVIVAPEIHGTVKDAKGIPLLGVTIKIKGTGIGTVTDASGRFSLEVPDSSAVLVVSYIGYDTKQVALEGRTTIPIILVASATGLNEVVVVGYGTQKKADLTGSVATVTPKQLENRPVTSTTNALEGTMSGVTVLHDNGQPGRDVGTIRIRGIGTLNNSDPMVVVDGVISSMSDVNPNDIASISVLKDAASAAIYGSRAANGVILITTKKGSKGHLQMHYNFYIGKQKPTALPDFLPSWQAATLYNNALQNEGKSARYTPAEIQKFKDGSDPYDYPNTDWLSLFYNGDGLQQNHYLDVSGGSDKTQYMFSLGYFDQDGIVKGSGAQRYTTRLNLSSQVTGKLKVNANISYSYEPMKEPTNPYTGDFSQLFRQINRISPIIPYKYANGDYGYISDGNPMAWLEEGGTNQEKAYHLLGIASADWQIIKGLHFKPMIGYRLNLQQNAKFIKDIQYYDHTTGDPTFNQGPNSLTDYDENTSVVTLQGLLNYSKTFGGSHHLEILGGYSQEYTRASWLQGYRKNFLNNSLSQLNAGPTDGQQATGSADELALRSVFGRVNYNYKGKYLLEGNLRYDGSSRFAKDNQWGIFPSVSAGWNVSEENFFSPLRNWFTHLKIRGSWGKLGNQNIVLGGTTIYYPAIATISAGQNYSFGGTSPVIAGGIAPTAGANNDIKWESTEETDIGLDAGFLNERLTFSADYFIKNTSNILLNVPVGAPYGLSAPVQNAGAVQNKGWEFSAGYQDKAGDFSYDASVNASFIKNEVTDLDSTGPIISGGTFMQVGYPIHSFYGYISQGIFQTQKQVDEHATESGGKIGPGDLMYRDLNGDSVINGADRAYLGTYFPKVTFGLTLQAGWKGIDVTVFFQGAAGVKNYLQGEILGGVSDGADKPTSILLDAWTPENHSTKFPRLWYTYQQNDPLDNPSSFWVRDASYIRLKNLQVGYSFPQQWVRKVGLENARIYYSGQNIATVSSFYTWVDPESPAAERGYDYPQVKVNTVGINLAF
jgi:TonB-linked SusC/RagA family outer membrane protein